MTAFWPCTNHTPGSSIFQQEFALVSASCSSRNSGRSTKTLFLQKDNPWPCNRDVLSRKTRRNVCITSVVCKATDSPWSSCSSKESTDVYYECIHWLQGGYQCSASLRDTKIAQILGFYVGLCLQYHVRSPFKFSDSGSEDSFSFSYGSFYFLKRILYQPRCCGHLHKASACTISFITASVILANSVLSFVPNAIFSILSSFWSPSTV